MTTIGAYAILVAFVTAAGGYLAVRRGRSGTVATTDADKLWDAMMVELKSVRAEAAADKAEAKDLRKQVDELRDEHRTCLDNVAGLRNELAASKADIARRAAEQAAERVEMTAELSANRLELVRLRDRLDRRDVHDE